MAPAGAPCLGVFHRKAHVVSIKESITCKIDTLVALGGVMLILAVAIVMSLLRPRRRGAFKGPAGPQSVAAGPNPAGP